MLAVQKSLAAEHAAMIKKVIEKNAETELKIKMERLKKMENVEIRKIEIDGE